MTINNLDKTPSPLKAPKPPTHLANIPTVPQPPRSNEDPLAIASIIMGIAAFIGLFFLAIPAIVTGAVALKRNTPHKGLAATGIVTGTLSLVAVFIIMIMVIIAFGVSFGTDLPNQ